MAEKEFIIPAEDIGVDGAYFGYTELIRCNDCQHFEYDHVEHVDGVPLILAHEICTRWGKGCKTSKNGYCFMAERKGK